MRLKMLKLIAALILVLPFNSLAADFKTPADKRLNATLNQAVAKYSDPSNQHDKYNVIGLTIAKNIKSSQEEWFRQARSDCSDYNAYFGGTSGEFFIDCMEFSKFQRAKFIKHFYIDNN